MAAHPPTLRRTLALTLLALGALSATARADFPEDRPTHPRPAVVPAHGPDPDRDGVLASNDLCERTPKVARVLITGCSAFDIVRSPEVFTDPAATRVAEARRALSESGTLRDATRGIDTVLREGSRKLVLGGQVAAAGDVCGAARTARSGADGLRAAEATVADIVTRLRGDLRRQIAPAGGGDADLRDVEWHAYGYGYQVVAAAVDAGNIAASALAQACSAIAGPVAVRGRVRSIDDASADLTLVDGRQVALPRAHRPVYAEGAAALISGVAFKDHTIFAKGGGGFSAPPGTAVLNPCLTLGIAPYQQFNPPLSVSVASYVIHSALGYRYNGQLWLERAMRLSARSAGCSSKLLRRSLQLELTYWDSAAGATKTVTLASDLTEKDHPVPLPAAIAPSAATLTIIEREQHCGLLGCLAPTLRTVRTAKLRVRATGAYGLAGAKYSATVFDLDDDDQTGFRTAKLTGVQGGVEPGVPVSVEAEGFRVVNGVPTATPVLVKQGQPFAIFNHDFYSDDPDAYLLYPATDVVGVSHAAGLRWPRMVGVRNGHPFRYSIELPTIVRDAVDFCTANHLDALGQSFYGLPWRAGVGHSVMQGNFGALTHQGNQAYAFDFDLADGEDSYAARGGTVKYVQESLWKNSVPGSGQWEPANELRIEHQDGTVSLYFHMQQWGVIPEVGDRVHRGDPVGITGNTGNSTGPHLHYQVNLSAGTNQSIPIRFHVNDVIFGSKACYVPQQDDFLISDNT